MHIRTYVCIYVCHHTHTHTGSVVSTNFQFKLKGIISISKPFSALHFYVHIYVQILRIDSLQRAPVIFLHHTNTHTRVCLYKHNYESESFFGGSQIWYDSPPNRIYVLVNSTYVHIIYIHMPSHTYTKYVHYTYVCMYVHVDEYKPTNRFKFLHNKGVSLADMCGLITLCDGLFKSVFKYP